MSSSTFIESSTTTKCSDLDEVNEDLNLSSSDTNLVVVYGKKGVSLDPKGMKNLLEEKITSVSVIRVTSPTPSMEEEEEQAEKLKKLQLESDKDSRDTDSQLEVNSSENESHNESNQNEDHEISSSNEDGGDVSDNASEENDSEETQKTKKPKGRPGRKPGKKVNVLQKPQAKPQKKERPDVIGLSVEAFYAADKAHELVKNVLKQAGVPLFKRSKDYEFQMYVINNDHCYTPYTSPSQVAKKESAEKLRLERQAQMARKLSFEKMGKKKPGPLKGHAREVKEEVDTLESEECEDEEEMSSYSSSEESVESDRDSDLDFKVNNRVGRKRKIRKKPKRSINSRGQSKRSQQNRDEVEAPIPSSSSSAVNKPKTFRYAVTNMCRPMKSSVMAANVRVSSATTQIRPASVTVTNPQQNPKKPEQPSEDKSHNLLQQKSIATAIRRGPIVQVVSSSNPRNRSQFNSPSHNVKEIIINKQIISSPKGRFTDISTLLSDNEKSIPPAPSTPKSSYPVRSHLVPPPSKGFTLLGLESAAKNQLPAQISVQAHSKSTPSVATDNELIDSIVDEMEKLGDRLLEQEANANENIPKLVEMLESTEKALESNNKSEIHSMSDYHTSSGGLDMSHAPLLEASADDIPDDLIKHVVKLIEDDKTLKEAVDKEVYGDVGNHLMNESISAINPPPLAPISSLSAMQASGGTQRPLMHVQQPPSTSSPQPKSIIQMTISNPPSMEMNVSSTSPRAVGVHTPKTLPLVRRDPIQVIRGNGRVITLPPIEAPTTRGAKRRAQVPSPAVGAAITSAAFNDSSLDNSMQSNASVSIVDTSGSEVLKSSDESNAKKRSVRDGTTSGRGNRSAKKSAGGRRSTSARKNAAGAVKTETTDTEAAESQDDDDPNKLWCVCRQPHNNRFMICCDVCEDWFHGSCVGISKATGIIMENNGTDWTCPKCEEKKQPKITDMLTVKKSPVNVQQPKNNPGSSSLPESSLSTSEQQPASIDAIQKTSAVAVVRMETPKAKREVKKVEAGELVALKSPAESIRKGPIVLTCAQKKLFPPVIATAVAANPSVGVRMANSGSTAAASPAQPKRASGPKVPQMRQQELPFQKVPPAAPIAVIESNEPEGLQTFCVVCKKQTRSQAIYCGDECIRKYVNNAVHSLSANTPEATIPNSPIKMPVDDKKRKANFEDVLLMADRKPKAERVGVFERRTGRILIGNNAPTTLTLRKWLQDNPTYEVILPGSSQAIEIEKKFKHKMSPIAIRPMVSAPDAPLGSSSPLSPAGVSKQPSISSTNWASPGDSQAHSPTPKAMKQIVDIVKSSAGNSRPSTPKQLQKYPQQVTLKPDKAAKTESKDDAKAKDKVKQRPINQTATTSSEPIRLNVRRTLKEQLLLRMKESETQTSDDAGGNTKTGRLTAGEVEHFVAKTEEAMYNYFNRDTGSKYKAKYRSLMFNIRDRKNHTLFAKICAKEIDPKQLVRLSPEELASQELAQWREQEAKHQLEMIKKSELDLLASNKTYVLKTHKGEEVIEGKPVTENLDLSIEDVVSAEPDEGLPMQKDVGRTVEASEDKSKAAAKRDAKEKDKDRERDREREKEKEKEKDRSRSRHHRSKSGRGRKSSRSRSKSRSRSHDKKHKTSSLKDERQRDRGGKERERERGREKERTKDRDQSQHSQQKRSLLSATPPAPIESFSLIDQILESTKTVEEAANLVTEKEKDREKEKAAAPVVGTSQSAVSSSYSGDTGPSSGDSYQEPTSTVSIPTPPHDPYVRYTAADSHLTSVIWRGNINMVDVASFQIALQPVIGNSLNFGKFLPDELDVVGRIAPDTVWDYIAKIKRSANKEIIIIQLVPAQESETAAYRVLYQYLDRRKRLGVIKTVSPQIKDFYIFPLGAGKYMPTVLQTQERVNFYEDPERPDMLVGILIRIIGKRGSLATTMPAKYLRKTSDKDSYTPPGSPKRRKLSHHSSSVDDEFDIDAIIKAPIVAKKHTTIVPTTTATAAKVLDDLDEPYSPGGSPVDSIPLLGGGKPKDDDFKREMEELNRKIAAQEMEIAGLLTCEPRGFKAPTMTPSAADISNISIPSDLPEILRKLKNTAETSSTSASSSSSIGAHRGSTTMSGGDEEYNPEDAITTVYETAAVKPTSSTGSRLAQLSEAELLSMVPDDILIDVPMKSKTSTTSEKRQRCVEPPPPGV